MASISLSAGCCCTAALLVLNHQSCTLRGKPGRARDFCAVTTRPGWPGTVPIYACSPGVNANSTPFTLQRVPVWLQILSPACWRLLPCSSWQTLLRALCFLCTPQCVPISRQQISDPTMLHFNPKT